jgi:AcrR family transcriptional regulator
MISNMPRKYELKKRAERQQATRRRIVEAAVELHRTKGPARTTLSDIARVAGVQRHTLYRHFPDERAILAACSGLYGELHPVPDPTAWRTIDDPTARLREGLFQMYEHYDRTADMLARVLRDAEVHEPTRETVQMRSGAAIANIRGVLGQGFPDDQRVAALLDLALDFHAWKRLRASGLSNEEAAETMVRAIACR